MLFYLMSEEVTLCISVHRAVTRSFAGKQVVRMLQFSPFMSSYLELSDNLFMPSRTLFGTNRNLVSKTFTKETVSSM